MLLWLPLATSVRLIIVFAMETFGLATSMIGDDAPACPRTILCFASARPICTPVHPVCFGAAGVLFAGFKYKHWLSGSVCATWIWYEGDLLEHMLPFVHHPMIVFVNVTALMLSEAAICISRCCTEALPPDI